MKLFILREGEALQLIALVSDLKIKTLLQAQFYDPITGGAAPRTVFIRDEGDSFIQMVSFDSEKTADAAWQQLAESPPYGEP